MPRIDKYYCSTRQEIVGALSAALDMIEVPVEINHTRSGFRLTLDLSKVPPPVTWPEFFPYSRRKYKPTAEDKYNALPAEVRYRQAIVKWQKLVVRSPRNIWE